MIPGIVSKLSSQMVSLTNTLPVTSDIIRVTSTTLTTVLTTLQIKSGKAGADGGLVIIINTSGASITTLTTGNIATAVTIGQNVATIMAYAPVIGKWYPGALA